MTNKAKRMAVAANIPAAHWRKRAKAVREMADEMWEPEHRALLLELADEYDSFAEAAQSSRI